MSASLDRSRLAGASGCGPRIAWLPMTTNSSVPVTSAAAAITCSNCSRRTSVDLLVDPAALGLAEHSGERRVLAHVASPLRVLADATAHVGDRPPEKLLPLLGVALVDAPLVSPFPQEPQGIVDHGAPQAARERAVIGQAPALGAVVPVPVAGLDQLGWSQALGAPPTGGERRLEVMSRAPALGARRGHVLVELDHIGDRYLGSSAGGMHGRAGRRRGSNARAPCDRLPAAVPPFVATSSRRGLPRACSAPPRRPCPARRCA